MFCDLVGSTALASRLDPEDLREVIGDYHKDVETVVGRFDGFVAKYMGDGVLAYFGYPQAHEDDAERAIRAGLEIVTTARLVPVAPGGRLRVRVGIATGLVVVGDLVGAGEAQERGVVGETPNLAARLQTLAEPGSVVIATSTYQLTGDIFEYEELGDVELKGFAAPVAAWRVRVKAQPKAGSRLCIRPPPLPRSSDARRKFSCCSSAGHRRRRVKGGSCCSRASRVLESRA